MRRISLKIPLLVGSLLMAVGGLEAANASRIKDIAAVSGVRGNYLVGYGLVVGLAGTGDRMRNAPFTESSLGAMLERMGVNARDIQPRTQNVAAVMVTATLPAFARSGSNIDVQVSAIGDASSLQGGTLVMTPLNGPDGNAYAVAQGPLALSAISARGAGAKLTRGAATSAKISNGAIVEREVPFSLPNDGKFRLMLRNPDFTTASAMAREIVGAGYQAAALDNATVEVHIPTGMQSMAEVVSRIENLQVNVAQRARVVVDEASGTVVMGQDVRISPVAIAHGGMTITVKENPTVVQPGMLSGGETVVLPQTEITVDDGEGARLAMVDGSTSLQNVVKAMNTLEVSPRDLITILQALKSAGALQADIEVR